jgi:hypothetical protein
LRAGQAAGAAGLELWLAAEAERRVPEYKKAWPKYHYYYEWMRERVAAACGALPAPVLDKLLAQARPGQLPALRVPPAC